MKKVFCSVCVAGLVLTLGLLVAGTAAADEASDLYRQGVTAFDSGRFLEAAEAFRAAHLAKPHWKLLYNIGQSEAAAKRHGLALQAFEGYLSQGGDEVPNERREEVLDEVSRLRKMVGRVEVKAPEGALILLDGVERGTAPILGKIPVAASVDHAIWIELDGSKQPDRKFQVTGGDTLTIELGTPGAGQPDEKDGTDDTEPPTDEPQGDTDSPLITAGWVAVGVGGALLIGSAVTGSVALSIDGDLKGECEAGHCPSDQEEQIDKMDALAVTTNILIGVGAAAATTGVILLIVGHGKDEGPSSDEVALVPTAAPGFTGLSVRGRF